MKFIARSNVTRTLDSVEEAFSHNVVKVVLDARGFAMYFSRATIPWARDAFAATSVPYAGSTADRVSG